MPSNIKSLPAFEIIQSFDLSSFSSCPGDQPQHPRYKFTPELISSIHNEDKESLDEFRKQLAPFISMLSSKIISELCNKKPLSIETGPPLKIGISVFELI